MKIGIVNDLDLVLHVLSSIIKNKTKHQVIWTACNGLEAIEKCRCQETPDIILMDLLMPVVGGVEATEKIMKENPCAILIVTSSVNGNLDKVFEAMGQGALDVVKTPSLATDDETDSTQELIKKIETIGMLIEKEPRTAISLNEGMKEAPSAKATKSQAPPLLVFGSSTGGPMALTKILSKLPGDAPFATIIIQHINQEFIPGFSHWLGEHTPLNVMIAEEGAPLKPGFVYLPESEKHLTISKEFTFKYFQSEEKCPFSPSIDILFSSLAKLWPTPFVGVLLTGMGDDGARGLKELNEAGWFTIAEDEKTCIVYGMPRVAFEMGAASTVLPIEKIADAIMGRIEAIQTGRKK